MATKFELVDQIEAIIGAPTDRLWRANKGTLENLLVTLERRPRLSKRTLSGSREITPLQACIRLEAALELVGVPLTGAMGGSDHDPGMMRLILRAALNNAGIPTPLVCQYHKDDPDRCLDVHICEHCHEPISHHIGTGFRCPIGNHAFTPDELTYRRFPRAYQNKPQYYHCGSCEMYHSATWSGDCREDAARFNLEDIDAKHGPHGWEEIGVCAVCGTPARTVIGAPDGAEVCQACFDEGAH